ncbi:hypothetical protein [Bacillus thuringiensis]
MHKNVKQSTELHDSFKSFVAYCTECPGGYTSQCYDARPEALEDARVHNNALHNGEVGATVIGHHSACSN